MNPARVLLALLGSGLCALAQAPGAEQDPAPRRRSLADGLVRQVVEVGKIALPTAPGGLELGAGEGPLVMVVRRADGTLDVQELDRGAGDHGESREKAVVTPPEEDEVREEAGPEPKKPVKVATVRITRRDEDLAIGPAAEPLAWTGKQIAEAPVLAMLREQFQRTRETKEAGNLLMEVGADAFVQDLLTTWSLARQVGFRTLLLSPVGCDNSQQAESRAVLRELPKRLGWKAERVGPKGMLRIYDGELLIALDGPVRMRDVSPWFVECAQAGIWRIGFVCQKDAKTRVKVPTDLPFDRGL